MSELFPLQKNSTLSSKILHWIQYAEPKGCPLPLVILQECLTVYIKKQVLIIETVIQNCVHLQLVWSFTL